MNILDNVYQRVSKSAKTITIACKPLACIFLPHVFYAFLESNRERKESPLLGRLPTTAYSSRLYCIRR